MTDRLKTVYPPKTSFCGGYNEFILLYTEITAVKLSQPQNRYVALQHDAQQKPKLSYKSSVGDIFYAFPDYLMVLIPFKGMWAFVNVNKNHVGAVTNHTGAGTGDLITQVPLWLPTVLFRFCP